MTTKTTSNIIDGVTQVAVERLVAAAERLTLGSPTADAIATARAALEALVATARLELFPSMLKPVSIEALADFRFAIETGGHPIETTDGALLRVHASAFDEHDEVATIIRSPRGQNLVRRYALSMSMGDLQASSHVLDGWMVAISAQVVTHANHPLAAAARVLVDTAPTLAARLDAVEQRHHAHAEAEATRQREEAAREEKARLDQERAEQQKHWAAALRSEDREARTRRENLADHFRQYPAHLFPIKGQRLTGQACANDLLSGAPIYPYYQGHLSGEKVKVWAR